MQFYWKVTASRQQKMIYRQAKLDTHADGYILSQIHRFCQLNYLPLCGVVVWWMEVSVKSCGVDGRGRVGTGEGGGEGGKEIGEMVSEIRRGERGEGGGVEGMKTGGRCDGDYV